MMNYRVSFYSKESDVVSGIWFFYLFHTGNKVLIVAHASSLEACTRQIQGLSPQNSKDFVQVVRKVGQMLVTSHRIKCLLVFPQ